MGLVTSLKRSIANLDRRLVKAVADLPETEILLTFPYMSPTRIATLLAGMGAAIEGFPTDRALRNQWG